MRTSRSTSRSAAFIGSPIRARSRSSSSRCRWVAISARTISYGSTTSTDAASAAFPSEASVGPVPAFPLFAQLDHVRVPHFPHQLVEPRGVAPAELGPSLARVAEKRVDLGRPEIARIDLHKHSSGRLL